MSNGSATSAPVRSALRPSTRCLKAGRRGGAGRLLGLALLTAAAPAAADPPPAGKTDPGAGTDPRILLVDQQAERTPPQVLAAVEKALADDPLGARELGLDYLRGHLLLQLGRRQEALEAFAATMGAAPSLGAYSRYRLAVEQEALGHPEVAAGLAATLLGSQPPAALVAPAMQLLERTVAAGGDCRLLRGLEKQRWRAEERRRLALARAGCALRSGEPATAQRLYRELLEEERGDEVAHAAASSLVASWPDPGDARSHLLIGLTFHNHREFQRAIHHLARALVRLPAAGGVAPGEEFECRYALARSHFWLGRYAPAAAAFDTLARLTENPDRRAQALYQKARCLELAGDWENAAAAFSSAYQARPGSRQWADAALISGLRLRWLSGDEAGALEAYGDLVALRQPATASRALLFLASSALVSGRADDRTEGWLSAVAGGAEPAELHYWRGRLEESRGRLEEAATHYARILGENAYHPFAAAARRRLERRPTAAAAARVGSRLAASPDPADLYAAWLLLGADDPQGQRARRELDRRLAANQAAERFQRLALEPAARWPLWRSELRRPEEMLLALGLFNEGSSAVLRHFPVAEPALAFTGSFFLAKSGEIKQSLYIAEILAERIPGELRPALLSPSYRRLLYPLSHGTVILRETATRGVDPFLLAAIIREESRFDPRAYSAASARGLTQFILPTAQRIAGKIGLGPISTRDLERPETAIALGAAYLEELLERFGDVAPAVAAYNAGEAQAELWRRYCLSEEPEEYLTKVAFRQTRDYVTKVLTSREHYAELYAPAASGD